MSLTKVFTTPAYGRYFFEAVIRDKPGHLDLRRLVAALLGRELTTYTAGAMAYDLRRLARMALLNVNTNGE